MKTYAISLVIALCAAFAPKAAEAQIVTPAICNTAREIRQFFLGVRKGRNLAAQAIARLGEAPGICDDLEAIQQLQETAVDITDGISLPPGAPEVTQCHVRGQIAGLLAEILELQEECVDVCILDGEFIGEIAALLYCELSIALDGLTPVELFERLATTTCGAFFEESCDDTFFSTATTDAECLEYTQPPHEDVFLEAQNNQCASNPAD